MTMIEPEKVSYEDAGERGLDQLLDAAADRPIAVATRHGDVILARREVVDRVVEEHEDLLDALLLISRALTDKGERFSLDEVVAELGLTDEEIEAAPD